MKILVLAGGVSNEREVSMTTGRAIYESLKQQGHDVLAIDPASGRSLLDRSGEFIPCQAGPPLTTAPGVPALVRSLNQKSSADIDLVFLALHGGAGEDGTIQNLLELSGKKYTGSSMVASAVAMNKAMSKRLFSSAGVNTPEWELYRVDSNHAVETLYTKIVERFAFPLIVKPNGSGSTVGLSKVDSVDQLPEALRTAAEHGSDILVERHIAGREMTVAVLDAHAFPVVEIIPHNELYDYEAKYTEGGSEYVAPAEIPDETGRRLRAAAVTVYEVIGASGLARVDFILAESGEFHCLELNTLPGMTNLSLAPMAAKCEGISFDQLVDMMIQSAFKRED